jgi:general stress protein 26
MDDSDAVDRAWALMRKIGYCMLCTHDGAAIRARPMAAQVDRATHAIYFLTDIANHTDDEIASEPHVCLAFADPHDQKYVAVTGRAAIANDRAKIKALWSTPAKAWWRSADEPSIRVLKVTPEDAQFWDSPGTVMTYVKMLAAVVADRRPAVGERAKVKM